MTVPCSWASFPPVGLPCLVSCRCEGFCLVLLYLVVMFGCCLLETYSFLKGDGGVDGEKRVVGGGDLGGVEGVEAMVRIYCMREKKHKSC